MSCSEDYATKSQRFPSVREYFKILSVKRIKLVHAINVFIQKNLFSNNKIRF